MKSFYCNFQLALLLLSPLNSSGKKTNLRPAPRPSDSFEELEIQQEIIINDLVERMKPRNFFADADAAFDNTTDNTIDNIIIPPKQFFHLHHMKSGGSSLNRFLGCGLRRAKSYYSTHEQHSLQLNQQHLSECSYSYFKKCTTETDHTCNDKFADAAYMEYCAPLSATEKFGWGEADAVTMLRNPVERVWSMFRFQTKSCFKCHNLTDVYDTMDKKGMKAMKDYGGGVCLGQLTNHITRNLQSIINNDDWSDHTKDNERFIDALNNLQNRFVVVGLLDRLDETVDLLSHSFPWLKPELEGTTDEVKCDFPHVNSSPGHNGCGEHGGHWDLPALPDDATRMAIEDHNKLDMKLYEAAKLHFELQLKAAQDPSTNE